MPGEEEGRLRGYTIDRYWYMTGALDVLQIRGFAVVFYYSACSGSDKYSKIGRYLVLEGDTGWQTTLGDIFCSWLRARN